MPICEIKEDTIRAIDPVLFSSIGVRERQDLQRLLRNSIEVIAPGVLVVSEEFGDWEDSKRRIDLLGIDKNANLVVIELKRTEDGGHMELQAIRYAAMISTMTFTRIVSVFQSYLKSIGSDKDAEATILEFLEWDEPDKEMFAQDVQIVLASADFSKEITTSVMWLNQHGIDIRCVRIRPYQIGEKILLDIQQIIPLPEATDYQVRLREKAEEVRLARHDTNRDLTRFDLSIDGIKFSNLPKRRLVFHTVQAAIKRGATPEQLQTLMTGSNRWLVVDGECTEEEFHIKAHDLRAERGALYEPRRYFNGEDELFRLSGKTYALTKMWGTNTLPTIEAIREKFPDIPINYTETA